MSAAKSQDTNFSMAAVNDQLDSLRHVRFSSSSKKPITRSLSKLSCCSSET